MRARFNNIETDRSGLVKLTLVLSPKMWDILHYTGATEFDVYVAEDPPREFPITSEILENSGFVLEEVGDNGAITPPQHRDRYEKWVAHTKWQDCVLWYDRHSRYYHIQGLEAARLASTRQLQRALNLIGMPIQIDA